MSLALERYLDRVMAVANIKNPQQASDVRAELSDHLQEKVADLESQGIPREDAVFRAVEEHGHPVTVGYGLRPRWSLVDVRSKGTARGIIAIGPRAVGVFAFGGVAIGVFACGGLAIGVVTFGGMCLAAMFAFAGIGIGTLAYGGFAVGLVANGGFAAGVVAFGGFSMGLLAQGGMVLSYFTPDEAPKIMQSTLQFLMEARRLFVLLPLIFTPLLLILITISNLATYRENKRLREADSWLLS